MPAWLSVLIWWVAFGGTHSGLSWMPVRGALVDRLGERAFQGVYTVVSFATFVPLMFAYFPHRHSGPLLWNLRAAPSMQWVTIVLAAAAFALLVSGVMQPSAVSFVPGASPRAQGVTRITRHPVFMAMGLWGLAHLLMNGWLTDVIFFGGFAAYALVGSARQDARKQATAGAALAEFYRETSLLPFGAIAAGRNRLVAAELPWRGVSIGVLVGVVVYLAHGHLFGV